MSIDIVKYFDELTAGIKRGTGNSTLAIAAVKATPGLLLVRASRVVVLQVGC